MKAIKKRLALVLAVALLLSACQTERASVQNSETQHSETSTSSQMTQSREVSTTAAPPSTTIQVETNHTQLVTASESAAPSQAAQIAPQLSYREAINKDMYSGFSDRQIEKLNQNGFVVIRPNHERINLFMHHFYEGAEYSDQSVFITTDAVLNMFHTYYSNSMKALESTIYYNDLNEIALSLTEKFAQRYATASEKFKAFYQRLYAYGYVGAALLNQVTVSYADATDYAAEHAEHTARWQSLQSQIPAEVNQIVQEELHKIGLSNSYRGADGSIMLSQVFNQRIDYSQYTVRGHYTQSELLSGYFKAMMWFSNSGFKVDRKETQELVIAQLLSLELAESDEIKQRWQSLYSLTSLYSGFSDDLDYRQMAQFIDNVYGENGVALSQPQTLEKLLDSSFDSHRLEMMAKLPTPRITPVIDNNGPNADLATNQQLKLMGQRFSFDAYAMTHLMKSPERPVVTPFDILASMSNQKAEEILYQQYAPDKNWPEYPAVLAELQSIYQDNRETVFTEDLYHGWLYGIDLAMNEQFNGEIPYFMSTDAYAYKQVNSALGSLAELKHDNVLYAKQVMAEAGGGDDENGMPLHFVEPYVKLYDQLRTLTKTTRRELSARNVDDAYLQPLKELEAMLTLLVNVSKKELNGEFISQDELYEISYFGGLIDYLRMHFYYYITENVTSDFALDKSSALISDIATSLQLGYLELANGLPYEIYALVEVNGETVLTKGIVYSAYSFYSDERLTDEKWQRMNGIVESPDMPGFVQFKPSLVEMQLDKVMPYTREFMTGDSNQIFNEYIEMKWPK